MSPKVFFPPFFSSSSPSSPSPPDLRFFISPRNFRVLYSPHHFFDVLAFLLRTARNRVVLSSLYFGSGSSEAKLFELLRHNAERNGQNFKIDILMDFMRGTRENDPSDHSLHSPSSSSSSFHEGTEKEGNVPQPSGWRWRLKLPWLGGRLSPPSFSQSSSCWIPQRFPWPPPSSSSAALVAPLLDLPSSVSVSLFYHPFISRIAQALLPARVREVLGVMHMKVYLADDTLIMTGANLSKSYLTNRQDRYIIIRDPQLADCIHSIVKEVQKMSFALVDSKMTLRWVGETGKLEKEKKKKEKGKEEEGNLSNPMNDNIGFRKQFGMKMEKLLKDLRQKTLRDEEDERCKSTAANVVEEFPERSSSIPSYSSSFLSASSAFSSSLLPSSFSCYVGVFLQAGFALPPLAYETSMLHRLLDQVVLQNYRVVVISGYLNLTYEFVSRLSALVRKSFDCYHNDCLREQHESEKEVEGQEKEKKGGEKRTRKNDVVFHSSPVCLISAAPEANSFFESKGISRFIPAAYACVAERCLKYLLQSWRTSRTESSSWSHQEEGEEGARYEKGRRRLSRREKERRKENGFPLILWEYQRKQWTFHSKGIWVYPPHKPANFSFPFSSSSSNILPVSSNMTNHSASLADTTHSSGRSRRRKKMKEMSIFYNVDKEGGQKKEKATTTTTSDFPFATIVGSSNFGYRAAERDLELSVVIYTQNKRVKEEMQMEMMKMKENCKVIENPRKLKKRQPWWMQWMIEKGGGKYFL